MKHYYIFGYGSLVSVSSLNRTLQRPQLTIHDLIPCYLLHYQRSWTLLHPVFSFAKQQNVNGVFLNIQPQKNSLTNGVIFKVNETEFVRLQERESSYLPVDVTSNILLNITQKTDYQIDSNTPIITFVSKKAHLITPATPDLYIFEEYEKIMPPAFKAFHNEFWDFYQKNTLISHLPRLEGSYTLPQ